MRKLYETDEQAKAREGAMPVVDQGLLTIDEYKSRVETISKLDGAIVGLRESGDPALKKASEHMFSVLQKLGDSLALGLASYARAAEGMRDSKTGGASVGYYVDDVWEALGRYAYHIGDGSGTESLCSLRYALEKIADALAPPEPPQPAADAALDDTISEYEREQEPDPGLIRN